MFTVFYHMHEWVWKISLTILKIWKKGISCPSLHQLDQLLQGFRCYQFSLVMIKISRLFVIHNHSKFSNALSHFTLLLMLVSMNGKKLTKPESHGFDWKDLTALKKKQNWTSPLVATETSMFSLRQLVPEVKWWYVPKFHITYFTWWSKKHFRIFWDMFSYIFLNFFPPIRQICWIKLACVD